MAKINVKAIVPIILTGVGIAGVIATTAACQKDTAKAMKMLDEADIEIETKTDQFKYTWKCYIPTMVTGTVTILSIAAAGYLSHKTEMALAAALALNKDNLKKFETKAREIIGEDKVREIKQEVAKADAAKATPPKKPVDKSLVRLYDPYTEQFIDTSIEKISLTMLAINKDLTTTGEASYNKLIRLLGGKESKNIDMLGWSLGNDIQDYNWSYQPNDQYWIEIYTTEQTVDNQTFQVLCFNVGPEIQGVEDLR